MIASPADLGRAIRGARIQAGLSQAELAHSAGVSRKLIGDLEAGKGTAELGPALHVASRVGLIWQAPRPTPQAVFDETAELVRDELKRGDADFALRLALDGLKRLQVMKPTVLKRPGTTGDARWDALLAAGARVALRDSGARPRWGIRLAEPWFPAEGFRKLGDAYRELIVRRTPKEFAEFNVYLNDKSLEAG